VTLVLAHRGANRFAPDNTLAAFERAVELGADGVELDIHRTADGALVVRHDAATPFGLLAEMTAAEVRDGAREQSDGRRSRARGPRAPAYWLRANSRSRRSSSGSSSSRCRSRARSRRTSSHSSPT
jgi:glycerophosphoryl diester phosphodiesterase